MAKYIATSMAGIVLLVISIQGYAQCYGTNYVNMLDCKDQEIALKEKIKQVESLNLDIAKTRNELSAAGGGGSPSNGENIEPEYLKLIKITGLESAPKVVFSYNGYRLVADKGEMIFPTLQLRSVSASRVMVKDVKNGQEYTLWLNDDAASGLAVNAATQ